MSGDETQGPLLGSRKAAAHRLGPSANITSASLRVKTSPIDRPHPPRVANPSPIAHPCARPLSPATASPTPAVGSGSPGGKPVPPPPHRHIHLLQPPSPRACRAQSPLHARRNLHACAGSLRGLESRVPPPASPPWRMTARSRKRPGNMVRGLPKCSVGIAATNMWPSLHAAGHPGQAQGQAPVPPCIPPPEALPPQRLPGDAVVRFADA